ncbi:MAG: PilZ domain-containing protein [Pseudomonadota bacterium]
MESKIWGGENRRRFFRVSFHTIAFLENSSGRYQGNLLDISLKGALFELAQPWDGTVGGGCTLIVPLRESEEAILMDGIVAHMEKNRLGISCRQIDLDSITNLRRLVELNLGDEALLQRELSALIESDQQS